MESQKGSDKSLLRTDQVLCVGPDTTNPSPLPELSETIPSALRLKDHPLSLAPSLGDFLQLCAEAKLLSCSALTWFGAGWLEKHKATEPAEGGRRAGPAQCKPGHALVWRLIELHLWERACSRCRRCGQSVKPRCCYREQARSHRVSWQAPNSGNTAKPVGAGLPAMQAMRSVR